MKNFYSSSDYPDNREKENMWQDISQTLPSKKETIIPFHWKSFWIGNAAAIILIFAGIGLFETIQNINQTPASENERVYENLNQATRQLEEMAPVLIQQASASQKNSMESTLSAIREIDRLIAELKNEMLINGITPSKEESLKRLYANKLDFYKELLLTNRDQL